MEVLLVLLAVATTVAAAITGAVVVASRAARTAASSAASATDAAGRAAEQAMADRFAALSAEALDRSTRSFLTLAEQSLGRAHDGARADLDERRAAVEHLVEPLHQALTGVEGRLRELETVRERAYATLHEQVRSLAETQDRLRSETANLVTALRNPSTRGRWGELQLRRVVEVAGMLPHCDFVEQPTMPGDGVLRPDLVVHLPGDKHVVVDAKAPLGAYLEAVEASDEGVRRARLADHARQVRSHVDKLSSKAYWERAGASPQFVFLFVPGDQILAAAHEADPGLYDFAADRKVQLTSPSLLIVMLQAVATGWQQEALAENAQQVCALGRELYQRLGTMAGHVEAMGGALKRAVGAYNDTVGSLERRVLVTARRFEDLGVAGPGQSLEAPSPLDTAVRPPAAPELVGDDVPGRPAPIVELGRTAT